MENFKNEKILVVIPARGGSKRIPKKNIKPICGIPMIYWPLNELTKIFSLDQILVSTDDEDIIKSIELYGLKTEYRRPAELADDFTGTTAVAYHAFKWFEQNKTNVDYVLIVYPTAVLLSQKDILNAFITLKSDEMCHSVFTATTFSFPIQRAIYINNYGFVEMFEPENYLRRSQDFQEAFHDAGQFYFCKSSYLRSGYNPFGGNSKILKLSRSRVIDIDTPEDFEVAENLLKIKSLNDT